MAYNKLCQATPSLPDCSLPLYWPAPEQWLSTAAGHHRFLWDLHYDPLPGGGGGRGGGGGNGAVPHRTYPGVNSPWVPPGAYTVRLTVDGKQYSKPITVKMDPRVKETPAVLQIYTLTAQMEDGARTAGEAAKAARDVADALKKKPASAATDALVKEIDALAPPPPEAPAGGRGFGGFGGRGGGGGRGGRGGAGANTADADDDRRGDGGGRDGHARLRDAADGGRAHCVPRPSGRVHGAHGEVGRAQAEAEGRGRLTRRILTCIAADLEVGGWE